ncbi:MAG: universal stress protein [Candidatus Brocadiales bacterium]
MVRLRNILCAVDYSRCSMEALAYAIHFALKSSAKLYLLYIIDMRHFDDFPPFEYPGPESETVSRMKKELALKVSDEVKSKINVDTIVTAGTPVQRILSIARERDVDMIVMGTHGRTGVARAVMGSVAANVLKRANCAVLTVRWPG